MLSDKLKKLREESGLPQRKIAAALDIDTATYSKIENGLFLPQKEQIRTLSKLLSANEEELYTLWLVDKILNVVTGEEFAYNALKIAIRTLILNRH